MESRLFPPAPALVSEGVASAANHVAAAAASTAAAAADMTAVVRHHPGVPLVAMLMWASVCLLSDDVGRFCPSRPQVATTALNGATSLLAKNRVAPADEPVTSEVNSAGARAQQTHCAGAPPPRPTS